MLQHDYIDVPKGQGDEIETPPQLFDALNKVFNFEWDACATAENTKIGVPRNCIERWPVANPVFMNPPYSNPKPFLARVVEEQAAGTTTVTLIKGDPSTTWWNDYVAPYAQIKWIPKRIRFYYKGRPLRFCSNFPSVFAFYWGFTGNE